MARILGVDLPNNKKVSIGLTYLYGIGPSNVKKIIASSKVDPLKKIADLTEEEISRIQKALEGFAVEGDLRREVEQNIKRLEDIGSYRGLRHRRSLPSRGQRTRSNARTRRGKRKTVGASSKEAQTKTAGG
ncbi:MAG: 30S ribosomal protein S13 [Candidatus Daviesbacteria bacterium]|nr:MAG: 30S ribosomal protein S13 [Candidatus Daviesbacteria bacterium]